MCTIAAEPRWNFRQLTESVEAATLIPKRERRLLLGASEIRSAKFLQTLREGSIVEMTLLRQVERGGKKRMRVVHARLDRAKQRVDWHTGIRWVLFDDVHEEVWNLKAGAESAQDIQKYAQEVWETKCFGRTIYLVEGEHKTKAEAFETWWGQGVEWQECMQRFAAEAVPTQEALRKVDADFKQMHLERCMPRDPEL